MGLKEVVFSTLAHYNYGNTCVNLFFKISQKFVFLGKTANFKFWASIKKQHKCYLSQLVFGPHTAGMV